MAAVNYLLKKSNLWPSVKGLLPPAVRARLRGMAFRRGKPVAMDPQDRAYLIEYYREDILKLAALLGRDLSRWLR
jgi:hypothetical protein